ncbi:MAG: glycosyltransferase [Alloprevotella sp.]|nr:glycosyltransferase [Alloprevotella sp.]
MNILHVINNLVPAGAERLLVDIAKEQQALGEHVEVLAYMPAGSSLERELADAGITLHTGRFGHLYNPLNAFAGRKAIRRADVIHVHLFPAQYWVAAARRLFRPKAAVVTTEHSTFNARCRYRLTTWTDRMAYRCYDAASCISPAVVDFMRERTRGRLPLRLIENGINVRRFASAKAERSQLLSGVPEHSFLLMQVALFREQKNQDCVIRALTRLPDDVHAVFVGDGERRAECQQLAGSLGVSCRTHFLGSRSDVPQLLSLADVVVMSSHWEGFGLAAVEGMAAGKPVLASRVEGLAAVVGREELLFIPDDDLQLSKKVLSLRADSETYARAADYCRARAAAYDIANTSKKLIKFYADTIKGEVER